MRKLVLYIASSFDHYIARSNGDISWLNLPEYIIENEDYGYNDFYKSVDCTIMGNTTYKIVQSFDMPFPYAKIDNYVFTRNRSLLQDDNVMYVHDDIAKFVSELKNKKGKNIWLIGGGQINQILLNYNLIDEIILTVMPIILGHGVKLFHGVLKEKKLNLTDVKHFKNGVLQLKYVR